MKKILYTLMAAPIFFLSSCSSGGSDNPTPQNNITGVWELTELEFNGDDLMPAYSEALTHYHSNGTYELKGYLADGSYVNGVGEYSISNGTLNTKSVLLTGPNSGLYQNATATLNWTDDDEISTSGSIPCLGGTGFSRSVKTTHALGTAPSNSIVGVWETTYANLAGQDVLTPNYSQVLDYFWSDGTYGTDLYFLDGSFDWAIGSYSISNDQTTITTTSTLYSTGQTFTASMNITEFEIDEIELYTSNFLNSGPYTVRASRSGCYPLSNWKK
jgi:hypothetical protein